jgi:hypothetical protein
MSVNPPPDPDVSIFNNLYWIPAEGGSILGTNNTFTGTNTFNNDFTLNQYKIHLGTNAGAFGQEPHTIAIGTEASGFGLQGNSSIAIGNGAAVSGQSPNAIAIGADVANAAIQASGAVAIGYGAQTEENENSIAIGYFAQTLGNTATNSIAIGKSAEIGLGATNSIAIGNSVSVGTSSGAVAIGSSTGTGNNESVCIGITNSMTASTTSGSVCIGNNLTTTGGASVNIGTFSTAGSGAVATGYNASATGLYAIAIGRSTAAAFLNAVSIGYQATCTAANQITLGTTISTIRLNTITPLYTAIPTFTSAQVGFISTTSGVDATALNSASATTILTTASMPIGLYTIFVRVTMTSTTASDVGVTINLIDAAAANVIKGQTIINDITAPPLFMSIPYSNSSAQAFTLTGIFNAGGGHNAVIANTGSSLTNVKILRIA